MTPTIQELVFTVDDRLRFEAGQYLELEVPHHRPDSRGTRRPFSIVSAPEDLPTLRIAYRDGAQPRSSFKTALAAVDRGGLLHATGVWGDFLLPADPRRPILLLAGGIGITPFVSQLRHLTAVGQTRDIVLVYVVSDATIAFRDEIAATGIATVVFAHQAPDELPAGWTLAPSAHIDGESLLAAVPDLSSRDVYVSGPPRLIADLTPSLRDARTLTTDAFAGY
ncbi:MAG: FAD-dependent oxidoreductase [Propionicimonas sp.]|nr:FAD-dependent oxidoreductase [Propionicimonas sp.]